MTRTLATVLLLLAGCGGATLDVPDDFVVLEDDWADYDQRATTADGVVLSVRRVDNVGDGGLDFWARAVANRMRLYGGYALLEEPEVRLRSGARGRQLRFGRDEEGTPFLYWVTLFVDGGSVYVIEAGGRTDRFDAARPAIERAIARFTPP